MPGYGNTKSGGIVGMFVMFWTLQVLIAMAPADIPRIDEVSIDWRVLLAAGLTTILTGVLVGVLPALSSASVNPQASLQDASRGTVGGTLRRRARAALVIAEVALAVAITTGAVLLLRSFVSVTSVNPGFETANLLTFQMNLPIHLTSNSDRLAFYRDFFARMEALPGVASAGGTTRVPLGSTSVSTTVQIEGRPVPAAELPEVQFRRAMHSYFAAMGIPIRRGRGFDPNDGPNAPPVAVINETMARRLFPNEDPIGKHVRTGPNPNQPWTTIVGVIGDVRHGGLEEVPQPELYINYLQGPPVAPFIVLRTTSDPALLAETVRAEARRIDKNLPLYDIRTMATLRSEAVSTRRFILLIVGAFGALALGLAAIGVYGVMSLIVSERTREVGVRLALGAEPAQLLTMIVGQAAKLAGLGVIAGLAMSLPIAPLLDSQLYGITSFDPLTFVSVPIALLVIAALAAMVPARKAMRIDPLAALRIE
jgi:putative ABC transport system permease protein